MKKLLALTLAAAAAHVAHAQSSVTIYGLIDEAVELSNSGDKTEKRLVSGGAMSSRLGFRGTEDLGGGLSAVFRLESGLLVDTGTFAQGGSAFGREASVGLSSRDWGTLQAGRLPTPYYSVQSAVDAFSWYGSGGLTAISRSAKATQQLIPLAVNARSDNALGYVSPRWAGLELRLLASVGEKNPTQGPAAGASLRYNNGPLDLVAAYQHQSARGEGAARAYVVGGSYDFGITRLFAGVTDERNDCLSCTGQLQRPALPASNDARFRLINIGAKIPSGAWVTMVQYTRVQDRSQYATDTSRDANWFAIGGEYFLSKRSSIYTTLGTVNNRNGSQYALGSGSTQQPANFVGADDPRSTTFNIGIKHVF